MKYEFKGTPGTWVIEDAYLYGQLQLHKHITVEGRFTTTPIATCYSESLDRSEMMANLRLITASPLLLSALIKAVEDIENFPAEAYDVVTLPEWYSEAKSAIEAALNLKTVQP